MNAKIYHLISILENFLNCDNFEVPKHFSNIISESSLLPLLENAFRSTSLVEMAKEELQYKIYVK